MTNKTIDDMNRKPPSNKDYWNIFLLVIVLMGMVHILGLYTRIGDLKSVVNGYDKNCEDLKMEIVEEVADQVITLFYKDIRMQEYNDGWDKGYSDCTIEGNSLHNLDGGVE